MTPLTGKAAEFLALHVPGRPLLQPNAFDAGSARLLAHAGFAAIATTSSGFAATLGKTDGSITRDQALEHCRAIAAAVEVPVAADTENCFADDPTGVAETVRLAAETGLAGCSVEDYGRDSAGIYDRGLAAERVAAAVEAGHGAASPLVVTARADGLLRGSELPDVIARLQAFEAAGADVLFAPGVRTVEEISAVVSAVSRPVNVLVLPGSPSVTELAELGVARISVGGGFAWAAYGAVLDAATALRDTGRFSPGEHRATIQAALQG